MANLNEKNKKLGWVVTGGVAAMLGLAFASAPLYDLFCRVTGYGGTPMTEVERADIAAPVENDRTVRVMFDAHVNKRLDWAFKSDVLQVEVQPGIETLAIYRATNTSDKPLVGTATFNVSPPIVGQYVAKMECFCFTEQELQPGEEMPMPVSFFVDPAMFDDPNTADINDIVLSYTFHPSVEATAALQNEDEAAGGQVGG